MNKQVKKARKRVVACYSCKGHDFCCEDDKVYVKRVTNRAKRRLSKALAQEHQDNL